MSRRSTRSRPPSSRSATTRSSNATSRTRASTAVQQVGYDAVVERDVAYPRQHWADSGRVLVKDADDAGKSDLLQAVAAYVTALRE